MPCVNKHTLDVMADDQYQNAFLSLFVRRKLEKADYATLYRKDKVYFPRSLYKRGRDKMRHTEQISDGYQCLVGYEAKLQYSKDSRTSFTVDCKMKPVSCRTVWEEIDQLYRQFGNSDKFRKQVESLCVGRNVLTSYNLRSVKITGINWKAHENTSTDFDKTITYKVYMKQRYGLSSSRHENCLLESKDRKGVGYYLPQHVNLIFNNDNERILEQCKKVSQRTIEQTNTSNK
eukprot:UN31273